MTTRRKWEHPFIHTASQKKLYIAGLTPDMIDIQSIAEGLSKEARFAGQTPGIMYTVAQHSVLMALLIDVPVRMKLQALLHDAAEAYIGDQVKPIKVTLPDFNSLEDKVQKAIYTRFNVSTPGYQELVKNMDDRLVMTEALQLFHGIPDWIGDFNNYGVEPLNIRIKPWSWRTSYRCFMMAFSIIRTEQEHSGAGLGLWEELRACCITNL